MKALLTLLCALIVYGAECQVDKESHLLDDAYKHKSKAELIEFIRNWNQLVPLLPKDSVKALRPIQLLAYQAAIDYYNQAAICSDSADNIFIAQEPFKIFSNERVVYSEKENEDYIINYIHTHVKSDSLRLLYTKKTNGTLNDIALDNFSPESNDQLIDSIIDFRPSLNCKHKSVLILTPVYRKILTEFILLDASKDLTEQTKRKAFLENHMHIRSLNDFIWSDPSITSITFDSKRNYARLEIVSENFNYNVIMQNVKEKWILISTQKARLIESDRHGGG